MQPAFMPSAARAPSLFLCALLQSRKKGYNVVSDSTTIAANTWYRFTKVFTTPDYTDTVELELRLEQAAVNDSLYWACAQIEQGDAATPWTLHTRSEPIHSISQRAKVGLEMISRKVNGADLNKVTGQREHVFGFLKIPESTTRRNYCLQPKTALDQYAEPQVSYEAKEIALGEILGFDHEKIFMGDTIYVIDRDFGWELETRCVERDVDLLNKEESDYVFGNFIKALSKSQIDAIEKLQNTINNTSPPNCRRIFSTRAPLFKPIG